MWFPPPRRAGRLAIVSLATPLVACGEPIESRVPGSLSIVRGSRQSGTVGAVLAESLVVKVLDTSERPLPGARVAWAVTFGSGSVSADMTVTDAGGLAAVAWTLGTIAAGQSVTASVSRLAPQTFTAMARADRPTTVRLAGDSVLFTALGDTIMLAAPVVTNRFGNAAGGSSVRITP